MLRFQPWSGKWWNKPLVDLGGHIVPAELAVLAAEAGPTECGAWLNSTSTTTGVVDLLRDEDADGAPTFQTQRESLPEFVSETLVRLYEASGLRKGCPDLVIWDVETQAVRLVEVKCPHWDRPSAEQEKFLVAARGQGIPASIVQWEFAEEPSDLAGVLARVSETAMGRPAEAAAYLRDRYPFTPVRQDRLSLSKEETMAVFVRDGFIDRYSGERLVNPGALRLLAYLLPDDFPYHPNGRQDQCHIAFWELCPSVDHVIPLALGGAHEIDNFATTSMQRNLAKRNTTLEQLGWTLHEPGDLTTWDGLSSWLIETVEGHPGAREVSYIRDYYRATAAALSR